MRVIKPKPPPVRIRFKGLLSTRSITNEQSIGLDMHVAAQDAPQDTTSDYEALPILLKKASTRRQSSEESVCARRYNADG
jgi:hypothetical protein